MSADGNCATTVQKVPCSSSATRSGAITGYERGITGYVRTRALHKEAAPPRSLICRQPILKLLLLFSILFLLVKSRHRRFRCSASLIQLVRTFWLMCNCQARILEQYGARRLEAPPDPVSVGTGFIKEDSTFDYFGSKCWQSGACNRHDVAGCASSTSILHKRFITPF